MPALPTDAIPPKPAPPLFRAGTLTYNRASLSRLFVWLLAGEVVFTLIDNLEPKVLPILLKGHGASDTQIGIIVGSINAVLQLLIMPPLGYFSDRLRTRWGRRIPILFWITPFVTFFLALTPFAPEIAGRALSVNFLSRALQAIPVPPVILIFGIFVVLYRATQTVTNVVFFGLLRDVVPDTHMGRFLALFRLVGAGGTFIVTYWLLARVENHSHGIFIGVAILNFFGFFCICWLVREGRYPDIPEKSSPPPSKRKSPLLAAVRNFVSESYAHPVYLWTYFLRVCLYGALLGLSQFTIFFPRYELGLDLEQSSKLFSWPLLAWLVVAYPVGRLMDIYGAMRILGYGLAVITLGYVGTFFFVVGEKTFFVSAMITGVAFWVVMMAQLKVIQEIFHPQRYSQLAGANTIVQSIAIAIVISPVAGWLLDAIKGWHYTLPMPGVGPVVFGPYRLVNLMMAFLYGLAWFGLVKARRHWIKLGGPNNYEPPL